MEIAKEKGFEVSAMEAGEEDHIHIFVSGHPKISPSYMVKMIKGISGRKLFMKFPGLKNKLWGGYLWNPFYYIETIGSISDEGFASLKALGYEFPEVMPVEDALPAESVYTESTRHHSEKQDAHQLIGG